MNREKALRVLIACVLICCSYLSFAQGTSSQGKEFWTAYMAHVEDNGESEMALYITADRNTKGVVEIADGSFEPIKFNVTARQVTIVSVPRAAFLMEERRALKGLHITAENNIAVYAHIFSKSVSGATLLLPVNVLGKNYYSINYTQESNAQKKTYSVFNVIATEDNTTVEITPSNRLIDSHNKDIPFQIVLKKGEVYQGLSARDLTNTKIRSISSVSGECKKIAVFSGSTKIGIGCNDNNFTSDNLFQQVYPIASWGRDYITVPLKNRDYDVYRVILSAPNTLLKINGVIIPASSFQNSNYYEFSATQPNHVIADKPIQVVQYAVTQGKYEANSCLFDPADVGDPEMIYLNPVEQTLDHVTLYSATAYLINREYINVVIKANMASTFKLDGVPYTKFTPLSDGSGYAYAQIEVGAGTHYISAADGFNAIAYGFGANESYGYSAGANLKNLNEYISLIDPVTNVIQENGCSGLNYKLQLVLSYQTSQIKWNFDNTSPQTFNNPVGVPFIKDGKTLYKYDYPGVNTFSKGNHSFTATVVTNPLTDECGATKDIDFNFNIAGFAVAGFTTSGNLCSASEITLHDESIADEGSVTKINIYWDYLNHPDAFEVFSIGEFAADKNYKHTYDYSATSTPYTIKMIVYTGEGGLCDNGITHEVIIKGSPSVAINSIGPMCQTDGAVQFIADNKGFAGNGIFSGTGVSSTGLFDPAISGTGTFTITYHFIAPNGCDATVKQDVVVNPLPTVNAGKYIQMLEGEPILLPAKASGSGLTYVWEPAIDLDNPNVLNPVCSATEDRPYKLTVTTAAGCTAQDEVFVKVLKKPIVVNAFTPNGDGINDTWTIKYLDTYPGNTVDIYNRQGEKVYSSVGYASPWDGRYHGNVLPTGTYYYIINPKNGRKVISGNVTIIK